MYSNYTPIATAYFSALYHQSSSITRRFSASKFENIKFLTQLFYQFQNNKFIDLESHFILSKFVLTNHNNAQNTISKSESESVVFEFDVLMD